MSNLKEKIRAVDDINKVLVDMSRYAGWGNIEIELRTMKAIDRAKLLRESVDQHGKMISEKFQAGLIIASAFDPETGEKLFSDDDFDLLMGKSAAAVEYLSSMAIDVSGLNRDTAAAVEKNF